MLIKYKTGLQFGNPEFLISANNKANADQEILGLTKAGFMELVNDLTREQLQWLEALVPNVTTRIDHISDPHAYAGVAAVQQTINGIGTFNVVPDATAVDALDYGTLRQTDVARLQTVWGRINNSLSNLVIMEVNQDRVNVPGFRQNVLTAIGLVLSKPAGRQLIYDLDSGSQPILIMPASVSTVLTPDTSTHRMGQEVLGMPAGAMAGSTDAFLQMSGMPGKGTASRVELDPKLQDDTTISYDKSGKPIRNPIFVILAHELIHAKHNALGTNAMLLKGSPGYTDKEEQNTIENEENPIRAEHLEKRLAQRVGHSGDDRRRVVIPK